jgi:hypothetical protein
MDTIIVTHISTGSEDQQLFEWWSRDSRGNQTSEGLDEISFLLGCEAHGRKVEFQLPLGSQPQLVRVIHERWQLWVKGNTLYLLSRARPEAVQYIGREVMAFQQSKLHDPMSTSDDVASINGGGRWPTWEEVLSLI